MPHPFFFGYGSLVNRKTHNYQPAHPARARGWRRIWRHTGLRKLAYLSVVETPGAEIDGLIAAVPNGDWAALDAREHAYDRLHMPAETVSHDHPQGDISVEIYRTKPTFKASPGTRHPILQSYLDTVLLGYLDLFGRAGVSRFINSTDGWDSPVLQDRNAPIYPRAVLPDAKNRHYFDDALDEVVIDRIDPQT